jgi:hypothetical protein
LVFPCQLALSTSSSPVTDPPVEAMVSLSGNSEINFEISLETRSIGWSLTLSQFPKV